MKLVKYLVIIIFLYNNFRYAPQFVHNLHHLVSDLSRVEQKLGSIRLKSSSLGRSAAGLASSGTRSWSSKDLLSLGQSDNSSAKSKIQVSNEYLFFYIVMCNYKFQLH